MDDSEYADPTAPWPLQPNERETIHPKAAPTEPSMGEMMREIQEAAGTCILEGDPLWACHWYLERDGGEYDPIETELWDTPEAAVRAAWLAVCQSQPTGPG
jgi:hypothetical protein